MGMASLGFRGRLGVYHGCWGADIVVARGPID